MTQITGEFRSFGKRVRIDGETAAGAIATVHVGGDEVRVQVDACKRADGHWWGSVVPAPSMGRMSWDEREEYEAARGNPGWA